MWKKLMKELNITDSYISMGLGLLVVLVVGVLLFNYFKGPNSAISPEGETTEDTEGEGQTGKTHTVKAGETLWTISQQYYNSGYNWTDIANANKLTNPDDLEEGMQIVIPEITPVQDQLEVATATPTVMPTAIPTVIPTVTETIAQVEEPQAAVTPVQPGTDTYTVKRGDSLWKIAVALYQDGYRWVDIARANNLANPDIIHAGNVLKIPR